MVGKRKNDYKVMIGKRKTDYKVNENYSKNLNGDLEISSLLHAYYLSSELSLRV